MGNHELDIIRKFKRGDELGLRLLFDSYYTSLCVYAYKYFDSFDRAEDVVQEVFITLWEKNRMSDFNGSVKSYLFATVRNNSINKVKAERKFRFEEVEQLSSTIVEEKFESLSMDERKDKLYAEIEKLPTKSKKVFEAIVFEKMRYSEVAEVFNISVNTVKTHYSRSLRQLRSSLDILIMIMLP